MTAMTNGESAPHRARAAMAQRRWIGLGWLASAVIVASGAVLLALGVRLAMKEGGGPLRRASAQPEVRLHFPSVADLSIGENRIVFGFADSEGRPLTDKEIGEATVIVYDLSGPEPWAVETVRAQYLRPGWREISRADYYHNPNVLADGFFKATVRFPRAGQWGLDFVVRRPGEDRLAQRVFPNVLSESLTPPVGAAAPRSRNLTLKDVGGDLAKLDSDPRLNDVEMHRTSIAEAITARRPAVALFATPGFDEGRMSLPNIEILYSLVPSFGDRVEFIHVEIYDEKSQRKILEGTREAAPPDLERREVAEEWGVQNYPWLFFIDREGRIVAKFFGPVARSEVEEALSRLISAGT